MEAQGPVEALAVGDLRAHFLLRGHDRYWGSSYCHCEFQPCCMDLCLTRLVQKTQKKSTAYKNASLLYPSYGASNASIPGYNLGGAIELADATTCSVWDYEDRQDGRLLRAQCVPTSSLLCRAVAELALSPP